MNNEHIYLFLDNTVALKYLSKMGGRKPQLNQLAKEIWLWIYETDYNQCIQGYGKMAWGTCADPGIFVRGGSRSIWQKKLWCFLGFFFLVLSLFYRSQMVNFKENYHFSRFRRGSNFFQGGSNCLFPILRYPYNFWFSRGGSGPPVPPLDPHLEKTTIICFN